MIKLKLRGPWLQFKNLMKTYPERVKYVEKRAVLDVTKAFLEKLKEMSPDGDWAKEYLESLEIIELIGVKKTHAYGVISKRMPVKIGEVKKGPAAKRVGVFMSPVFSDSPSDIVTILTSVNPWPLDMIPANIPSKDVVLVYRTLTEGEMDFARQRISRLIAENRDEFRRNNIKWGSARPEDKPSDEMEGLPDYMFMALRAEFGINAASNPHWRPAIKHVLSNMQKILKDDENIRDALHNELFREHTLAKGREFPTMKREAFLKEAGTFQKKLVG